jgi:hypothetical protein
MESDKYPNTLSGRLLADIFLQPFSSVTQRYARLNISPETGNRYKNNLIGESLIQPKKIITNSGWITLFELTQKGRMILNDLGYETKEQNETVEHCFWKSKISEYYKNKGFNVLVEEHINGKPDIIVIGDNKKVAVEIERDSMQAVKNIEKNLKAGFDEIICVATNKDIETKIRVNFQQLDEKVKILSVLSFTI